MHQPGHGRLRVMRRLAAAAALIALAGAAQAADSIWDHNGSEMLWTADGEARVISYLTPRAGLSVEPGTILFEGRRVGDTLEGTARIFRQGCPPAEYFVSGRVTSETEVVLSGAAPVRAQSGCAVVGFSQTSSNAVLRFTYLRAAARDEVIYGLEDAPAEEEYEGEPVGFDSLILPLPGGVEITVGIHHNVASHVMPDMVEATLTCRSGGSHDLTAGGQINVCSVEDVSADVLGRALLIDAWIYNHDTAACDMVRITIPYGGYCP